MERRTYLQALLDWHQMIGVGDAISDEAVRTYIQSNRTSNPAPPQKLAENRSHEPTMIAKSLPSSTDTTVKGAKDLASGADDIASLQAALSNFNGCSLRKTATNLVFVDGNHKSEIIFIGEGPGAEEDRQGLPFVGPSGKLLDKMLSSISLNREKVLISNTVFWRPPGNRTPTPQETALCMPFIERLIELVRPKIVVPLGGPAAKSLLGEVQGIGRLRGRWFTLKTLDLSFPVAATPTFHPAYLLRTPLQKRAAWQDFKLIRKKLDELC